MKSGTIGMTYRRASDCFPLIFHLRAPPVPLWGEGAGLETTRLTLGPILRDKSPVSELQSAPRDIAFDCPLCRGHLVAQSSQIGTSADCPHCSKLLFIPKAPYVEDETELPGVRRILKRTKARISQPKLSHAPAPESIRPGGLIGAKSEAETTRVRLAAVEAELELERGSAATLIQMRSEIAVERAASKKSEARAVELEENLNHSRPIGT